MMFHNSLIYLFANLTIYFVSELGSQNPVADDEMQFLQVRSRPRLEPRVVRVRRIFFLLKFPLDVVTNFVFALESKKSLQYYIHILKVAGQKL